jgi:hypothetical protein
VHLKTLKHKKMRRSHNNKRRDVATRTLPSRVDDEVCREVNAGMNSERNPLASGSTAAIPSYVYKKMKTDELQMEEVVPSF